MIFFPFSGPALPLSLTQVSFSYHWNYGTAHLTGTAQGVGAGEALRHGWDAALKVRGQRPAAERTKPKHLDEQEFAVTSVSYDFFI